MTTTILMYMKNFHNNALPLEIEMSKTRRYNVQMAICKLVFILFSYFVCNRKKIMSTKRVVVIGAGASGLTAIKCCLDEGLEPVCFERFNEIGGLWYYTEQVREDHGCVMKSTIMNTCKEMMCFSDFPPPKEFPNFMNQKQVWQYFDMYKEHFGLDKYIRFKTEVISVKPSAEDFKQTGQWTVRTKNHETGQEAVDVFDGVMVCTGHHAEKYCPKFPGLENFKGEIIHAHDYKDRRCFEGKKVLIIGIGNSGGDLAVELAPITRVSYCSVYVNHLLRCHHHHHHSRYHSHYHHRRRRNIITITFFISTINNCYRILIGLVISCVEFKKVHFSSLLL